MVGAFGRLSSSLFSESIRGWRAGHCTVDKVKLILSLACKVAPALFGAAILLWGEPDAPLTWQPPHLKHFQHDSYTMSRINTRKIVPAATTRLTSPVAGDQRTCCVPNEHLLYSSLFWSG